MKELLILLIIGLSLSIDAFSISTVLGITNKQFNKNIILSLTVGIFHFIMPLLGIFISKNLSKIIYINSNLLLGIILIFISLQMLLEYKKSTDKEYLLTKLNIILISFGVSIDSFTIGLGLNAITNNYILASFIFSLCSSSLTLSGLILGRYINKLLKKYSYLFSTISLFILGIIFLLKNI